jgi:hypothetical protein
VSEERHGDLDGDTVAEIHIELEGTSAAARDFHPEFTMWSKCTAYARHSTACFSPSCTSRRLTPNGG